MTNLQENINLAQELEHLFNAQPFEQGHHITEIRADFVKQNKLRAINQTPKGKRKISDEEMFERGIRFGSRVGFDSCVYLNKDDVKALLGK